MVVVGANVGLKRSRPCAAAPPRERANPDLEIEVQHMEARRYPATAEHHRPHLLTPVQPGFASPAPGQVSTEALSRHP